MKTRQELENILSKHTQTHFALNLGFASAKEDVLNAMEEACKTKWLTNEKIDIFSEEAVTGNGQVEFDEKAQKMAKLVALGAKWARDTIFVYLHINKQ